MMRTRTQSNNQTLINAWWASVQPQITLFLDVMLAEQAISQQEVTDAISYMENRCTYIQTLQTPAVLHAVQADLLAALMNMQQSLTYQAQGNGFSAESRYQMAQSNLDSMRLGLLAFNIML